MMRSLRRFLGAAAVLVLSAGVAQAQKGKPASMPATSKAHMSKADKDAMKATHRSATAARKSGKRAEKSASQSVKTERKALLRGIALSTSERSAVSAIEKRTDDQAKAIDTNADAAEKAGTPVTDEAQRLDALRGQERSDLRAALTPAHQTLFDANASRLTSKH